jgi:hypothetical protein
VGFVPLVKNVWADDRVRTACPQRRYSLKECAGGQITEDGENALYWRFASSVRAPIRHCIGCYGS